MDKLKIVICIGSACFARGNARNVKAAETFLAEHGLAGRAEIEMNGCRCVKECAGGPNVTINGQVFSGVTPERMVELLQHHIAV